MLKVLVAVLAAHTRPYPHLVGAAKRTWASIVVPNVAVVFYYGGATAATLDGRDVLLPVDDDLWHTGEKTLAFFDFALSRFDFDLVFRTNCSSYIDLPNLRAFVDEYAVPRRYYAGATGEYDGTRFATGSGFFLSRDLAQLSLDLSQAWNHRFHDDLALAQVLNSRGILPIPLVRCDLASPSEVPRDPFSARTFHFRCKTDTRYRVGDIETMWELHRLRLRAGGKAPSPLAAWRQRLAVLTLRRLLPAAAATRHALRATRRRAVAP